MTEISAIFSIIMTTFFTSLIFWKAPNRKIISYLQDYSPAVDENHGVEDLPPELYINDALLPHTDKIESLISNMNSIHFLGPIRFFHVIIAYIASRCNQRY